MGQVTIYLDSETEKRMLSAIKKSGLSKSKWIAELIKEKTIRTWPESTAQLAGAWKDFPTSEEIREDMGVDAERERL